MVDGCIYLFVSLGLSTCNLPVLPGRCDLVCWRQRSPYEKCGRLPILLHLIPDTWPKCWPARRPTVDQRPPIRTIDVGLHRNLFPINRILRDERNIELGNQFNLFAHPPILPSTAYVRGYSRMRCRFVPCNMLRISWNWSYLCCCCCCCCLKEYVNFK